MSRSSYFNILMIDYFEYWLINWKSTEHDSSIYYISTEDDSKTTWGQISPGTKCPQVVIHVKFFKMLERDHSKLITTFIIEGENENMDKIIVSDKKHL